MNFSYQAYDKSGVLREGVIDATDTNEASENLRKNGLFVSSVTAGSSGGAQKTKKMKSKKGCCQSL